MRKHRKVTINNYNNDIDYDKLAEAIVKAQRKAEEPIEEKDSNVKPSLKTVIKSLWYIIINKKPTNGELTTGMLVLIISFIFKCVSYFGFLLSFIVFGTTVYKVFSLAWTTISNVISNTISILFAFSTSVIVFLYSVMMLGASRETETEKDKNYIIALFSGVVSFVALVVTGVDLFKG